MSFTGQWRMKVESSLTPNPFLLTLMDDGAGRLSGSIFEEGGPNVQPIEEGVYQAEKLHWEMDLRYFISTFHAIFEAAVAGDRMEGQVTVSGYKKNFVATREGAGYVAKVA